MTSLATAMMSAALFSRKSRSGWLDELDGIRGDALVSPDGEVDMLMAPPQTLAATGLGLPIEWSDPSELDGSAEPAPPTDLTPAPHRANPAEMWHPDVVVPAAEGPDADLPPEQVVDPEDLLLTSGRPTGFRFSTFSTGEGLHVDDGLAASPAEPDGVEPVEPVEPREPTAAELAAAAASARLREGAVIPAPVGEPVIDDAVAWSPRSIALPAGEMLAMGEPLPIVFVPEGGTSFDSLVTEPVGRRSTRGDEGRLRQLRPLGGGAVRSSLDDIVPATTPATVAVPVTEDGTVVLRAGIVRLGPGVHSEVRHDSGRIRVELATAWCWATLGHECEPVTVSLPSGTLALEPGTTALVTVEDDASVFVAVASGHAVLVESHGSSDLPAGSVALAPLGGPAQVGHATLAEIDADPLVGHNRTLDTHL